MHTSVVTYRGQKRAPDTLELELRVLCEGDMCFLVSCHLSVSVLGLFVFETLLHRSPY